MGTPSSAICAARSGPTGLRFKQEQQELEKQFWDNLILWIGGGTIIINWCNGHLLFYYGNR
jgi:hypothetical protein